MLRSNNFWFFIILSMNFWLIPILPFGEPDELYSDGLLVITLLAAVGFQSLIDKRFRLWSLVAAGVIIASIALEELLPSAAYIENATFAVSFAAATALYFHIMTQSLGRVTFDTVFAAACAYILIGLFFASVFGLVLEADQNAFAPINIISNEFDLLYYSFATLTTLGAADILPVSNAAKMLTVFEAIIGLIYIAMLVGSIVGAFSAGIVATARPQNNAR